MDIIRNSVWLSQGTDLLAEDFTVFWILTERSIC
ncbi:hypothetical protein BANRA_00699 [Escherichia coli]|uniref:Uncharacterized protein n=1 Tax=Escherichia coli TaxID=562 RepID=A0A3P5DXJ0_ECOLX|nr:hypothetical protein BANRA_00699 [Escherichia coli]VCY23098.1 hypothetical protein BANRA_00605 [Escherichia coli]VCY85807.1 hypothetical protein BANRA_04517 [Escherichia coli]